MKSYNKNDWKLKAQENLNNANEMIHTIGQNFVRDPKVIAEMLAFSANFYSYSLNNQKLIFSQNPYAVYVQSFAAWNKMGYSVLPGEHGLKVFTPVQSTILTLQDGSTKQLMYATKEEKELYNKGLIQGVSRIHFKIGHVFDISQTNYPKENYPELFSVGYPSEMHGSVCKGLVDFAESIGYKVESYDFDSISLRGTCNPSTSLIRINSRLEDTQKLSTLSHELGHALENHGERAISAAQKEFEADAISILIQSNFGIELTDSRKDHLATHYKKFVDELTADNPDFSTDEIIASVDHALDASMNVFKQHIDAINECVSLYVPHERLLDYNREQEFRSSMNIASSFLKKKPLVLEASLSNNYDYEIDLDL